jgi:hypothetical protein
MKLSISNRQLLMDDKYYCDVDDVNLPSGEYPITFEHSKTFNSIMPYVGVPNKEILICWCKELCKLESICKYCDNIRVGRRYSGEDLLVRRNTFNQLYNKIRNGKFREQLTININ